MNTGRIVISILALGLIAAAVSGCGRRAALDTPSHAATAAGTKADTSDEKKPERHFILDPLID
jgi:predicted small lipoprotein YifL